MQSPSNKFFMLLGRVDWVLMLIICTLGAVGVYNLYSAAGATGGHTMHLDQLGWFSLGMAIIAVVSLIDYRLIQRWAYIIFVGSVTLLLAVALVGTELNGSKRWLDLGFFLMQPSELLKIAVIIVTARYFHDRDQDEPFSLVQLVKPTAIILSGVVFVFTQPDLGTSLIIMGIYGLMVLFEGMRWQAILVLVVAGIISTPFAWVFGMKDYQKARVISFLQINDDALDESWQVRQSVIAFGSGRVWGKGAEDGTQIQKGFVPEHETDFASANWGEEHGFVGMMFMLGLFLALLLRALWISANSRDRFGAHIGVGVAALFFLHIVVNLGMVTGMLPVVGLTLPLISYGGSSMLTMMLALGLLLNVHMRRSPLVG
jgi:rod shape determining protein RodA